MVRCSVVLFSCLTLIALSGCASSPYSAGYPLGPEYRVSPGGDLRYKIPEGWLDASTDARLHSSILWFVRRDYAATIGVREVIVDEEALTTINADGLPGLARLIMKMTIAGEATAASVPTEEFSMNNVECCAYLFTTVPAGDVTRVVIVKAGSKVYEMTAMVFTKDAGDRTDVFSAQQSLVGGVQW